MRRDTVTNVITWLCAVAGRGPGSGRGLGRRGPGSGGGLGRRVLGGGRALRRRRELAHVLGLMGRRHLVGCWGLSLVSPLRLDGLRGGLSPGTGRVLGTGLVPRAIPLSGAVRGSTLVGSRPGAGGRPARSGVGAG